MSCVFMRHTHAHTHVCVCACPAPSSAHTTPPVQIHLVSTFAQVRDAVLACPDVRDWVLQEYVIDPLTLNGHKCHLRLYAVATGSGPLTVWVHRQALALTAAEPYSPPDAGVLSCEGGLRGDAAFVHLTNKVRGSAHRAYRAERGVRAWFGDVEHAVGSAWAQRVFREACAIVGDAFQAASADFKSFTALPNCYELFGFDVLVDAGGTPYLLEANAWPSVMGAHIPGMIPSLMDGVFRVGVEPTVRAVVARRDVNLPPPPPPPPCACPLAPPLPGARVTDGLVAAPAVGDVAGAMECVLVTEQPSWGQPAISVA